MTAASHHDGAKPAPETTIFVSGSRTVAHLDPLVRHRLGTIMARRFRIIVGDADGADTAVQAHLASAGYGNVDVFCAGTRCRNNVGAWKVTRVHVDPVITGRDFYTQKDRAMARQADYGFVLWNDRSAGSLANMRELLALRKCALVYLVPHKAFFVLRQPADLHALLSR